MHFSPPSTTDELLLRTQDIEGISLGQLAYRLGFPIPTELIRAKGWAGHLIEAALGAYAGSQALPDFPDLGIELKTLPINERGTPKESTYICKIDLLKIREETWRDSFAYQKLKCILWIPIEASPQIPIADRRIGSAILWSPTPEQEKILQEDWQLCADNVALGLIHQIQAHQGTYLQVRPKGANRRDQSLVVNAQGQQELTMARGFYLRPILTSAILKSAYEPTS